MKKTLFKLTACMLLIQSFTWNYTVSAKNNENPYEFQIIPDICSGQNFDVENIGNRFCLISSAYYEIDSAGTVLSTDMSVLDLGQDGFDFCPAIAVSKDSTVHIITRFGGNKGDGFNLLYSKKQFGKDWAVKNKLVGYPVPRNYVVDIVPSGDSAIYAHAEEVEDVKSIIHFYSLTTDRCDSIGAIPNKNRLRSDSDFRMKTYKDSLFLVSGFPYPNEGIFYMWAGIDGDLPEKLEESQKRYQAGGYRKGQPDLAIDQNGRVHFTYGAQYEVYYSSMRQEQEIVTDQIIMNELGEWHLNLGLSTLAVSDDGNTVLAVGLQTDNTKTASRCDVLWSISRDGGVSWTYPQSTGAVTYGSEGRLRPRLLYSNGKFYMFYYDPDLFGISMAILDPGDADIEQTAVPTISPAEANHENSVEVSISANTGTRIFYTTDGTEPAINSDEYLTPFNMDQSVTIKALACSPGEYPSEVSEISYEITTTSVNSYMQQEEISIYPNPGSTMITISGFDRAIEIKIVDMLGKVVCQKGYAAKSTQVDVSNLKKGLYQILVKKENNVHVTKFVKN